MTSSAVVSRIARPEDAPALRETFGEAPPFRRLLEADPTIVVVLCAGADQIHGALAVEMTGHPVDSSWAWVSSRFATESLDDALLIAMLQAAADALTAKVLAFPIDVGDRDLARVLEAAEFRPSGGAYRPLGPGMVEYLDGYTDPQGFQVDFVREPG